MIATVSSKDTSITRPHLSMNYHIKQHLHMLNPLEN